MHRPPRNRNYLVAIAVYALMLAYAPLFPFPLAYSFSLELPQTSLPGRTPSILDLTGNTIPGRLGQLCRGSLLCVSGAALA